MWRVVLAVIAGIAAWLVVATVPELGLRWYLPGYRAAEPSYHFTLEMQVARLLIGAGSTVAAGWVAGRLGGRRAGLWLGIVLLVLFVPQHWRLRHDFPLWYHAVFLGTLVPLAWAGGLVARRRTAIAGAALPDR